MVEALVSLSICSMLLVAAGSAFTSAAQSVQVNADFARATQAARVSLNQMASEIRQADSVSCAASGATSFDVIRPASTLTAGEVFRRYAYVASSKKLTVQIYYTGNTPGPLYTLASNVSAATFGPPVSGTDSLGRAAVQQLPIALTVAVGKNSLTVSGAAGSRRAFAS